MKKKLLIPLASLLMMEALVAADYQQYNHNEANMELK